MYQLFHNNSTNKGSTLVVTACKLIKGGHIWAVPPGRGSGDGGATVDWMGAIHHH